MPAITRNYCRWRLPRRCARCRGAVLRAPDSTRASTPPPSPCRTAALLLSAPVSAAFAPASVLPAVSAGRTLLPPPLAYPRGAGAARKRKQRARLARPDTGAVQQVRLCLCAWRGVWHSPPHAPACADMRRDSGARTAGVGSRSAAQHADRWDLCTQMFHDPPLTSPCVATPPPPCPLLRARASAVTTPLAGASFTAWVPVGILWAIASIPLVALATLVGVVPPPELPSADMSGQVPTPLLADSVHFLLRFPTRAPLAACHLPATWRKNIPPHRDMCTRFFFSRTPTSQVRSHVCVPGAPPLNARPLVRNFQVVIVTGSNTGIGRGAATGLPLATATPLPFLLATPHPHIHAHQPAL